MISRHRHIWKIESQVTQQSMWEMITTGVKTLGDASLPADAFTQPVIVTYKCEACGSQKVERV